MNQLLQGEGRLTEYLHMRTPIASLPPRMRPPSVSWCAGYLLFVLLFAASIQGVGIAPGELIAGIPHLGRILADMFPPSLHRLDAVGWALLETFAMALVGTGLGVVLSFPLSILASRTHTPHPLCYHCARMLVSLFRTVPDLIWALLFVVSVGLGPFAGTLAIMVDTIGFCGRFFAEAMEEVNPEPQEALRSLGARHADIVFCAVAPAALPSFINTSLFSLEKATRSSVVLGLVGAGGIGIELKVAMDMFQYDQAATIILAVFALVVAVEQLSAAVRRSII
ncbi:MAG: phosphonate ABC transporter, permease protein PhnE [Candidatus Binatia bacterium]